MKKETVFCNDYYEISRDYRLLAFNESVANTYPGIKVGDLCYQATMKRTEPCLHCPIAGNSDCDCPVYYDPFYETWMEAIFAQLEEDRYAVTCRPARDRGMRVFDALGKEDNEELIKKVAGRAANDQLLQLERMLQEKQNRLEESACEQEAQLQEIMALNSQLLDQQANVSEAYGMISGLSLEYHSLTSCCKDTLRIRVLRTTPGTTVFNLRDEEADYPPYDQAFEEYIAEHVVPEDREKVQQQVRSTTVLQQLEKNDVYRVNFRRIEPDGRLAFQQAVFANADTQDGRRMFVIGIRNIDELMKKEETQRELKAAMAAINAIRATIGVASWSTHYKKDGSFDHVVWSRHFRQLLGYSREEFPDNVAVWKAHVHPDDLQVAMSSYRKIAGDLKNMNYHVTYRMKTKQQGYRWFMATGRMVRDPEGRPHILYGIFQDVHEQTLAQQRLQEKQAQLEQTMQQLERASEAKTVFLNNMSHDIRTPMNAIIGFANLMGRALDKPEVARDYLGKIKSSSEYLLSIINNILDMARIESGKTTVDESFMDFNDPETDISHVFAAALADKNIKFSRTMELSHYHVLADLPKMQQIIMNLLGNAIKYTPEGGSVSMSIRELPGRQAGYADYELIISDTGIGMSREFMETIFDAFTREKNTTESKIIGTGLGMAIVKRLVDLQQGTIEVESELGRGTTFRVVVPHKIVDNPERYLAKQQNKCRQAGQGDFRGKRLLLAEDNELNAEIAVMLLEEEGFWVDWVADGVECVNRLTQTEAGTYAAILMDIQMPNMNGYEATRSIRSLAEAAKANIPIVAMTANAFIEDKIRAIESGMNGHVAKPVDMQELLGALRQVL